MPAARSTSPSVPPPARCRLPKRGVGAGDQAGRPKPDTGTIEALKKTLLAAKSIGYSTGPSGNYIITMFERLGVADQVKPKLKQTPTGVFVGTIVANGDVELGFQQVSEMTPFAGVDNLGPLPGELPKMTVFSNGISAHATQSGAATARIEFTPQPTSATAVTHTDLATD